MNNQTRNIAIVVAVIVVVGVVVGGGVALLNRPPASMRDGVSPFDVAARPMPEGNSPDILLPDEVGGYALQVSEPAGAGGTVATYGEGDFADQLHVVAHVLDSAEEARARVVETYAFYDSDAFTGTNAMRESVLEGDPAWLHVVYDTDYERFTWSRDNVYFDVQAPPNTLDVFMDAFPY